MSRDRRGWFRSAPYMAAFPVLSLLAVSIGRQHPALALLLLLVGAAGFAAALGFRCPRCRLGIDSKEAGLYLPGYIPAPDCPRCGRTRTGTWPFQWLLRPEKP